MNWLFFVSVIVVAYVTKTLIHRHVMKQENAYAYGFMENALSTIVYIPLLLIDIGAPITPWAWLLVLLAGALWAGTAIAGYHAYKYTHVSLKEPVGQVSIIVVFALSALLLHETITTGKIIGTLFVIGGATALVL